MLLSFNFLPTVSLFPVRIKVQEIREHNTKSSRPRSQPHACGNHLCFPYTRPSVLFMCAGEKAMLINLESYIDNKAKSAVESQGIKL